MDLKSSKRLRGCERRKGRQSEPLIEERRKLGRADFLEGEIRGYKLPPNYWIPIREPQSSP